MQTVYQINEGTYKGAKLRYIWDEQVWHCMVMTITLQLQ